ncbi:hypothetical protein TWF506_009427 [Arthrobotrys conoides]|uniref:Uncharacterized protein n=1 Tax=Arthrobotrys conoides TaxID=74498 RepID=A0AAN8RRJ8_9PEZI
MSSQERFQATDEFHASVPASEPMERKGYPPGRDFSGNSGLPELHAETYPPGTTQRNSSQPGAELEATDYADPSAQPVASDTLSGMTSKDVNRGVGRSVQGMSSRERHGVRKKEQQGVAWTGTVPVDLNAAESKKEAQDFKREFEGKED